MSTLAKLGFKGLGVKEDDRPVPNLATIGAAPIRRIDNKNAQRHTESYGGSDAIDWVMTCVDLYAQAASNAGWHFRNARGDEVKRPPGDLVRLLEHPNPYMDWTELFELANIDLLLAGEFMWWKFRMNEDGKPLALYRLPPKQIHIVPASNGVGIAHYLLKPDHGEEKKIRPEEVLHIKRPNPHDQFRGLGVVAGGPRAFDAELALTEQTASYYEQGTRLSGVLESERVIPTTTFDKLKRQFQALYGGPRQAGAVATLERGLKFRGISGSASDAELEKMAKWSRERVASAFRVPLPLLGDVQSSDRHAVREGKRIFDNDVMKPYLNRVASQLTHGLIDAWGLTLQFDYEYDMPIEDRLDLAEALAALPGVQVHQVLDFVNLPPTGEEEIDNLVLNLPGKPVDEGGFPDKNLSSEPGRPPNPENTQAIPRSGKLPAGTEARVLKKDAEA
jgi:HK97 family phage portal protein